MDKPSMVHGLVQREEAANESFLSGNMDRDTWTKELEDIDAMLNVVGLRMVFRPWEGHAVQAPVKGF
jgi:hypothetical protein